MYHITIYTLCFNDYKSTHQTHMDIRKYLAEVKAGTKYAKYRAVVALDRWKYCSRARLESPTYAQDYTCTIFFTHLNNVCNEIEIKIRYCDPM